MNKRQLINYLRKKVKPQYEKVVLEIKEKNIMPETYKYKILLTLKKIVKYGILVGLPFLATNYPDVLNLTVGGLLILIYDYLKHKQGIRLP